MRDVFSAVLEAKVRAKEAITHSCQSAEPHFGLLRVNPRFSSVPFNICLVEGIIRSLMCSGTSQRDPGRSMIDRHERSHKSFPRIGRRRLAPSSRHRQDCAAFSSVRQRHRESIVENDAQHHWDAIGRAFTFKLAS